jgi:stearoyl-CoA desaturase (Delta-9 desaturase)
MHTAPLALGLFAAAYVLNLTYMSVFYHRGLAHGAVLLGPRMRRFVVATGPWISGLDAKAWTCMHRLHHQHSDTPQDPHSPRHAGILGVFLAQLTSYEKTLVALIRGHRSVREVSEGLDFDVHWLYRRRLWFVPYVVHAVVAVAVGALAGSAWVGGAYFAGLMSHPIQGWMVNSLGHAMGYRTFDTPDDSRNNLAVGYLVMGEGYQNNHHRHPASARFSARWWEVDLGYAICLISQGLGLLRISRTGLIRRRWRRGQPPLAVRSM